MSPECRPECFGEYGQDNAELCCGCKHEKECRVETAQMEECFGFYGDESAVTDCDTCEYREECKIETEQFEDDLELEKVGADAYCRGCC